MGSRVLVVLASARPKSLGRHLAGVVLEELERAGASAVFHDLLEDGFDPVLRLGDDQEHATEPDRETDPLAARYARDVRLCDSIVVIHPVWWFAPPAILKGWIDRILVEGVALTHQAEGPPAGILGGKQMLVVQTFNAASHVDKMIFLGTSGFFWKRVVGLPTGLRRVRRLALYGVEAMDQGKLARFEQRLRRSVGAITGSSSTKR